LEGYSYSPPSKFSLQASAKPSLGLEQQRSMSLASRSLHVFIDKCCSQNNYSGVESILKKDRRDHVISTDFRSSSSDHARQQRRQGVDSAGESHRRSNKNAGCGSASSRRVLFKNNVSVYRFDAEPPLQTRNWGAAEVVSGLAGRRPVSGEYEGVRSDGHPHDIITPSPTPTTCCRHDNRPTRRPAAASDQDDRPRAHRLFNSPQRRHDRCFADKNLTQYSSNAIVGNFEVGLRYA